METYQKQAFLQALGQSGQCEIDVYGTSMHPFIRSGQRIVVTRPDARPRLGQIVGTFAGNQLIVHRIAFHYSAGCRTRVWLRGDAHPLSLTMIDYDQVVCTVSDPGAFRKLARPVSLVIGLFLGPLSSLFRRLSRPFRE